MALNHNLKLQEAIALEGYLGKQSPDMFHRYQQRYIKFLDHGLTLGYSDSKESFAHGKINGQIPLKDVVEVTVTTSNPKKFTVAVDGRTYKFEASSAEECTKWANAVKICREHALQQEQKSKEQVMAIDSDIRFEEANSTTESQPPSEGFFNPVGAVGAIANTAKKLIVGTAVKTSAAVVKTGVNVVGVVVGDKKSLKTNEEHLKAKHLDEALSRIDEKIVQSRVMMGYLLKEKKEATGVDLVDDFVNDAGLRDKIAQRWLFLISSKPINFDHVDPTDEETLDNGSLPFDIEQDVLYMYDEKCDDSKPLKSVYLKDVIDVVVWKKATNEQFYRFRLDLGERKINMLTTNNTEMMNWIKAIQASRANLKEKSRSKLPIVKNLYWHYKILADEGEEALREKMNKDYDKLVPSGNVMTADSSASLIQIQEKVADELIRIINACLSHKDEQNEVIKIAMEVYHEPILNALRIFFQKNQANLENRDIFEIGKFLSRYREQIRAYGDAFADPRITIGTATISKIVGTRLLKANLKPVKNIIKNDMDKEPEINGAGKAVTNAPTDIFKVLNETFNVLPLCNTKEMAFALLETCAHTLEYFINGLGTIIEYYKTTPDQLAAFCNNTISYNSSLKEFTKQSIELTHTSMETVAQYCDERGFTKSFISLGKKAYEKIAQILFSTVISEQWNKTSFLDISLRSLEGVLEKARLIIEKMHNNFAVKVEAACLEKAVTYYIQAFLTSAEKKRFKPDDRSRIIRKFDDDVREFADIFSNLKKGMIDNYTEPISNFHNFLMSKFAFLPITVQSLKEEYGSALKWSTIELLIKLRDDDVEKNEKFELLKNCEEIYRSTERKEEKGKHFNVFKHLDQESNLANMRDLLRHMSSESSITDEDVLADPNLIRVRSRDESVRVRATVLNLEGYLEVEKDEFLSNVGANFIAQLKFETKYFNLKKDILFYYKDKASESAQGSYKVKELVNFGPEEDDLKMFYITKKRHKEGETRTIRFKAVTQERRDAWVAGLKAAQTIPDDGAMFELYAADINLFKDTRALFVDIEELPSLDFPPPPGPPVVTRVAAASVSTKAVEKSIEKHSDMANSVENTNRRRSFALGDEQSDTPHVESTLQVEKEKKCCDGCAMF